MSNYEEIIKPIVSGGDIGKTLENAINKSDK